MAFEKPKKLTEIYEQDGGEEAFAIAVTKMVDDSQDEHAEYRDKCAENEMEWRNDGWNDKTPQNKEDESKPHPSIPILWATVENGVADDMDNFPDQVVRGVNYDDDIRSIIATEFLRFTLQRIGYRKLYEKKCRATRKVGVGTLYPFWNPELAKGLGDIDAKSLTIDQLRWDPKTEDINKGRFVAIDEYLDEQDVYEMFPGIDLEECFPDDENSRAPRTEQVANVRSGEKEGQVRVITVKWMEKEPRVIETRSKKQERVGNRTWISSAIVIGCKVFDYKPKMYEYNRYMINMTPYSQIDGEPVGLGVIDYFKDASDVVNRFESEFIANIQASSATRYLVSRSANINEKDLLNYKKKIIKGDVININAAREIKPTPFSTVALNYKSAKLAEVKEFSGQDVFNTGNVRGGVSSGVGIESMKESGAKRSRLTEGALWEDHRDFVKDILKLAQEHYDVKRVIRLSRESQDQIEKMINQAMETIAAQQQAGQPGQTDTREAAMAMALPEGVTLVGNQLSVDFKIFDLKYIDLDYDIQIIPQRNSPATSGMINAMVQQAVGNGQMPADLGFELMEWQGKEQIIKKVRQYYDKDAQVKQATQAAQEAADYAKQMAAMVEKVTKENLVLQDQVWNQKIKVLRAERNNNSNEEGTMQDTGEADEADLDALQAEISQKLMGKSA
jgi:hypothetical protein